MKKQIKFLELSIRPDEVFPEGLFCTIRIETEDKVVTEQKHLYFRNDFDSYFDIMMEDMKQNIKAHFKRVS